LHAVTVHELPDNEFVPQFVPEMVWICAEAFSVGEEDVHGAKHLGDPVATQVPLWQFQPPRAT